jgi:hypothetical protein
LCRMKPSYWISSTLRSVSCLSSQLFSFGPREPCLFMAPRSDRAAAGNDRLPDELDRHQGRHPRTGREASGTESEATAGTFGENGRNDGNELNVGDGHTAPGDVQGKTQDNNKKKYNFCLRPTSKASYDTFDDK